MIRFLTFDDVGLMPTHNNVESREIPNLATWLTKTQEVTHPILASNMSSVIGPELAKILRDSGTIPIFHRFASIEEQARFLQIPCYLSCGIGSQALLDMQKIVNMGGPENLKGIVVDVAQGHDYRAYQMIGDLKRTFNCSVIAGNICTEQGYIDLVHAGADAVKVGIGGGAACITRIVTGFGVPNLQALLNIRPAVFKYKVPMIADGGIRNSGDIVKALAAGACTVMLGKAFACTSESAAVKRTDQFGNQLALYKGQASKDFQRNGMTPEGVEMWSQVTGTANALIQELCGGIRSGLTYGGSRTIREFQRKVVDLDLMFEVGPSYATESGPRF